MSRWLRCQETEWKGGELQFAYEVFEIFRDHLRDRVAYVSTLLEKGYIAEGAEIIILAGHTPLRGASNLMKIETLDGQSS